MSRESKLRKKTVELKQPAAAAPRPSRIRREPPPPETRLQSLAGRIDGGSREWEIRLALAGMVFFAVAIVALVIDIGHLLSY